MFAKLTSTKLNPNRVSRQARPGFRPEPGLRVAPAHANDNHVTRHRSAEAAERPVLTCRWVRSANGGLECRWFLVEREATRPDEPGGTAYVQQPVASGGRSLALVVG
jgi:hypothetical protein